MHIRIVRRFSKSKSRQVEFHFNKGIELMSVNILMDRFATLSLLQQRAVCAIIGATVADAAVQPLHWIYDDNKLKGASKLNLRLAITSDLRC